MGYEITERGMEMRSQRSINTLRLLFQWREAAGESAGKFRMVVHSPGIPDEGLDPMLKLMVVPSLLVLAGLGKYENPEDFIENELAGLLERYRLFEMATYNETMPGGAKANAETLGTIEKVMDEIGALRVFSIADEAADSRLDVWLPLDDQHFDRFIQACRANAGDPE